MRPAAPRSTRFLARAGAASTGRSTNCSTRSVRRTARWRRMPKARPRSSGRQFEPTMTVSALTGGTGFVGSHAIEAALAGGHDVRALTRRPQPERAGVTWVSGARDNAAGLATMVAGADAVLHVAGVLNAPDRAGFATGNIEGLCF